MKKAILIPGNGGAKPTDLWYPYIKKELEGNFEVIVKEFPDSVLAREKYWLPFLEELGADENTILIGHSSGAIAAMRYAEKHPILGSVLIGTYYTDLGLENERISGYFDRPWDWNAIQNNQKWIAIFASIDDPWIPIEEPRFLKEKLKVDYFESVDRGHFMGDTIPEVVQYIKHSCIYSRNS